MEPRILIGESYLGFKTVLKDGEGFHGFIFCPVFRSELFSLISVHFGAGARQFQVVSGNISESRAFHLWPRGSSVLQGAVLVVNLVEGSH